MLNRLIISTVGALAITVIPGISYAEGRKGDVTETPLIWKNNYIEKGLSYGSLLTGQSDLSMDLSFGNVPVSVGSSLRFPHKKEEILLRPSHLNFVAVADEPYSLIIGIEDIPNDPGEFSLQDFMVDTVSINGYKRIGTYNGSVYVSGKISSRLQTLCICCLKLSGGSLVFKSSTHGWRTRVQASMRWFQFRFRM